MDASELARARLRELAAQEPIDLARASLAIAREEYPELDEARYLHRLDELAAAAKAQLPAGASTERRIGRLNSYLFHELGFAGNRVDFYDPRNSFLNEVLDRRTGIPITLSLVYLEVGRRCGLAVQGIGFPGHFLCRVSLGTSEGELVVDPFHRGQLVAPDEIKRRFKAAVGDATPFDPRVLRPARPKEILIRILQNLKTVYEQASDLPRALSAVDRILMLAPLSLGGLRDRAGLCEKLGSAGAAATALERVLELEPSAIDADDLHNRVRRLRAASRFPN